MLQMRDSGGTLRTITTLQMRDSGGTLRDIQTLYMRDAGGTLRLVYSAGGSGSVSPDRVNGSAHSTYSITVTTGVATASGGVSYAWAQTSGDGDWTILYPTQAATAFTHANTDSGTMATATFEVTITYAGGSTATATVTAVVRNISFA